MKYLAYGTLSVLSLFVSSCSTSYRIQVLDGLPKEVYLIFSKGADVKVGDLFILYQYHQPSTSSGGHNHGASAPLPHKQELGIVKVMRLVDETRAEVELVSGQIGDGLEAEKLTARK